MNNLLVRYKFMITRYLTICIFICTAMFFSLTCAGEAISILQDTPMFLKPDINSPVIGVTGKEAVQEAFESRKAFILDNPIMRGSWNPLMTYVYFYRIQPEKNLTCWVSNELSYSYENKLVVSKTVPDIFFGYLSFALLILLMLFIYILRSKKLISRIFAPSDAECDDKRIFVSQITLIIMVHTLLLCVVLFLAGNNILYPMDENGYFKIAYDLARCRQSNDWIYTLGLPVLYLPLVLISRATSYLDIVFQASYINAFIFYQLSVVLFFLIVKNITRSLSRPFWSSLIYSSMPFFYYYIELHDKGIFKGVFSLPSFNSLSYSLYDLFIGIGFNGMSDVPAMLFLFSAIFLALKCKSSDKMTIIVSAIFSFSCLIRISNIFFSPLIACIFWIKLTEQKATLQHIIRSVLLSLLSFSAVFSTQLVSNYFQFGSAFTFPYILHTDRANEGWDIHYLHKGINYIFGCNYLYIVLYAIGLCFMKNKWARIIFSLWGIPLLIFYTGYPETHNNISRFIISIFPIAISAFICSDAWKEMRNVPVTYLAGAVIVILANWLLISPVCRTIHVYPLTTVYSAGSIPVVLCLQYLIPIVSVGFGICLLLKARNAGIFIISFTIIYNAGWPLLLFVMLAAILLINLYVLSLEILKGRVRGCVDAWMRGCVDE